jgi:hypothetical protein
LTILEAGKSASLLNDVDGDGRFDPGDTIKYTIPVAMEVHLQQWGDKSCDCGDATGTPFPLDLNAKNGFTNTDSIASKGLQTYTFLATIKDFAALSPGTDSIVNDGIRRVNNEKVDKFSATVPLNFEAGFDIDKSTNGDDADSPTSPLIRAGDLVTWSDQITTTGPVWLSSISVNDDQGVIPVYQSCDNGDNILQPGETWIDKAFCTA